MDRIILHCDLNNFYASVECCLNPELADKPVAVCGSEADRHGIVLAKNYIAKGFGVTTAEPVWQAKKKCPRLVVVEPHYENYLVFSRIARSIYERYTDMVEPFGMDECWLDVTGSTRLFGSGAKIADEIRRAVKREMGVTISAGVSFNKIFAKLGSDMKKPDAVTCIGRDTFREQIWGLKAVELLGCGRQTARRLDEVGIRTIGDIANTHVRVLESLLGAAGRHLWCFANGLDATPVNSSDYSAPVKSIGRGVTTPQDLNSPEEVRSVLLELALKVGSLLRESNLKAGGVALGIKDSDLKYTERQMQLKPAVDSSQAIAAAAGELFRSGYDSKQPVRALTVRAINLTSAAVPEQLDMFFDYIRYNKQRRMEQAVDGLKDRFGSHAVIPAALLFDSRLTRHAMRDEPIQNFTFVG